MGGRKSVYGRVHERGGAVALPGLGPGLGCEQSLHARGVPVLRREHESRYAPVRNGRYGLSSSVRRGVVQRLDGVDSGPHLKEHAHLPCPREVQRSTEGGRMYVRGRKSRGHRLEEVGGRE